MQSHLHDLRAEVDDEGLVDRFAADWRSAGLDEPTYALMAYAVKLTSDPGGCGRQDIEDLRSVGFDDAGISSAVQVIGFFNYYNRIADGLGVEIEDWMDAIGRVK